MTEVTTRVAGIDTAKDKLDVAVHGEANCITVENDARGFKRLVEHLKKSGVTRVGIEATGGYERKVTRHLQSAGFTVIVFQPLQVKAYARLHLRRAKTDRQDAVLIAACTALYDARNTVAPDARFDALAEHLTFIEHAEVDIVRFKTRLEHIEDNRLRRCVAAEIARLEKRRDKEIKTLIAELSAHDDLRKRYDLVLSVDGIGERTALSIVVRMPELGQVTREAAGALAGLAPFVQQSGKHEGEAHIAGGRARLRRALYAAALPASLRWNEQLMALYRRLVARGKSHKCALAACARKLLVFANTVVANDTPWEKKPPAKRPTEVPA